MICDNNTKVKVTILEFHNSQLFIINATSFDKKEKSVLFLRKIVEFSSKKVNKKYAKTIFVFQLIVTKFKTKSKFSFPKSIMGANSEILFLHIKEALPTISSFHLLHTVMLLKLDKPRHHLLTAIAFLLLIIVQYLLAHQYSLRKSFNIGNENIRCKKIYE